MADPMPHGQVQLTGNDLDMARDLWSKAQESMREARSYLAALGALTGDALNDGHQAVTAEIAAPSAMFEDGGSVVVCYYASDGRCLRCWEDPPGICRACSDTKPGPKSPGPVQLTLLEA